jgi:hypothetical protein
VAGEALNREALKRLSGYTATVVLAECGSLLL